MREQVPHNKDLSIALEEHLRCAGCEFLKVVFAFFVCCLLSRLWFPFFTQHYNVEWLEIVTL
jgi:hypothetical protein